MSKNILIITGDAGESYEALYAIHRMREAGFNPVVAAPSKRMLNMVIHDFEPGWDTYKESPGYKVNSDMTFEEVSDGDFAAILILGGRAPEYLRHNPTLIKMVKKFDQERKWIFSICHGIQVLIAAGLASGKNLTCYEHIRYEVESNGGNYCEQEAVRDGHLVTAQTWQSHPEFYREVFSCLGEK